MSDDAKRKQVQESAEATRRANEEAMERMDNVQPTPTQEENDLAKLGVIVDDKEDDGSPPEQETVSRMFAAKQGEAPTYETRDASTSVRSEDKTKAKRGRKKKAS